MCSCEFNFQCASCARRWPADLDPYHIDWREQEQEQRDEDVSLPDFEKPFGWAA